MQPILGEEGEGGKWNGAPPSLPSGLCYGRCAPVSRNEIGGGGEDVSRAPRAAPEEPVPLGCCTSTSPACPLGCNSLSPMVQQQEL